MPEITVKVCGLTSADDVMMCQAYGTDILGFVVEYPEAVPWNLSSDEAAALIALIKEPCKSCIVTGGNPEKITKLAKKLKPSFVQLHYRETLDDARLIAESLKPLNIGVMKAFPPSRKERLYQFGTENVEDIIKRLCETDIFAVLIDSRTPDNLSGQGTLADTNLFLNVRSYSSKPVFLAGGITPCNVDEILKTFRAEYIDVMTGVEKSRGIKDEMKLKDLLLKVSQHY